MSQPDLLLYQDYETFYSDEYSLRKMPLCSYVRGSQFEVQGCAVYIPGVMQDVEYLEPGHGLEAFMERLPWERVVTVQHNAKFDAFINSHVYGAHPKRIVDTMGMAAALLGKSVQRNSLDYLCKHYNIGGKIEGLADVKGKRFAELTMAERVKLGTYCKNDVLLLFMLHECLLSEGNAFSRDGSTQEDWCMDMVMRMFTGPHLELDGSILEDLHADEVQRMERAITSAGVTKTALRSSKQFAVLLQAEGVELEYKKSRARGALAHKQATGEDTLTPALAKNDDFFVALLDSPSERVRTLAEARMAVNSNIQLTRARSYADVAGEGLWPVDLRYSGAKQTHRLSGGSGGGSNPQNLGRGSRLRDAIVAPEGRCMVGADLAGIELRVNMGLAGQEDVLDVIRANDADPVNNPDAYVSFAQDHVYNRPLSRDKTEYKVERMTGKVSQLSLGYSSGAKTFRGMLRIMSGGLVTVNMERAQELVYIYRKANYKVVALWRYLEDYVLARMANNTGERWGPLHERLPFLTVDWDNACIYGPSGLALKYPGLRRELKYSPLQDREMMQYIFNDMTYGPGNSSFVYGGLLDENLAQFVAREIFFPHMVQMQQHFPVAMSVHDELVCVPWDHQGQQCLDTMLNIMQTPPTWWPDLPMKAEGSIGHNYGELK